MTVAPRAGEPSGEEPPVETTGKAGAGHELEDYWATSR